MTRLRIEPRSPRPLANTLPTWLMSQLYIYLYIYVREKLKSSYDDVISGIDDILTYGIQTLQHWWKECVNHKPDLVIFYENTLVRLNFSADPHVHIHTSKHIYIYSFHMCTCISLKHIRTSTHTHTHTRMYIYIYIYIYIYKVNMDLFFYFLHIDR